MCSDVGGMQLPKKNEHPNDLEEKEKPEAARPTRFQSATCILRVVPGRQWRATQKIAQTQNSLENAKHGLLLASTTTMN